MIMTESSFLLRLESVSENFQWELIGQQIIGERNDRVYDPITAYVKVSSGLYVPRHDHKTSRRLGLFKPNVFNAILNALYHTSPNGELRTALKKAIGMSCEFQYIQL